MRVPALQRNHSCADRAEHGSHQTGVDVVKPADAVATRRGDAINVCAAHHREPPADRLTAGLINSLLEVIL